LDADVQSFFVITAVAVLAPMATALLRLPLPAVVLEIGLGIVIGPQLLGWAQPDAVINFLSEVGMLFLFFLAGMEIEFHLIRGRPATLGAAGWALSVIIALTAAVGLAWSDQIQDPLYVGAALCTTAMGTLMPILRDSGTLDTRFGNFVLAAGAVGEFGPVILISILLTGDRGSVTSVVVLCLFLLLAAAAAFVALQFRPERVVRLLEATMHTSSQLPVRLAVVTLAALVFLSAELELDVVLGGFAAGIIVGLVRDRDPHGALPVKLEAVGFGFFVPIFFVVSGIEFDAEALVESPGAMLRLPLFLALFLVARGVPALLLYRGALPQGADRWSLAFYSATQLPLVVAITSLALDAGRMRPENAAALVGAAMVSVLLFPVTALRIRGQGPGAATAPAVRAESAF
jgi:Kef-type K+ transport system membrane component KefB